MGKQKVRRRHRSSSEMYPIVESYMSSDLGQKAFCQEAGIPVSTLSYWQTKYRKEQGWSTLETHRGFMALSVEPNQGEEAVMELVLGSGHRLRFLHYPEVSYLQALLKEDKC